MQTHADVNNNVDNGDYVNGKRQGNGSSSRGRGRIFFTLTTKRTF